MEEQNQPENENYETTENSQVSVPDEPPIVESPADKAAQVPGPPSEDMMEQPAADQEAPPGEPAPAEPERAETWADIVAQSSDAGEPAVEPVSEAVVQPAAEQEAVLAAAAAPAVSEPPSPPAPSAPAAPRRKEHRRRSIFFPLLLIAIGAALLAQNLGMIDQNVWGTLISLWPLLFIAGGLDSLWRGEGVAGAVFSLGIGIIFLLSNYGLLILSPWQILLTIWPVLLVAIGYDVLVGKHKTIWTSLLGVALIAVLMAGALYYAGVSVASGAPLAGAQIEVPLQDAKRAKVTISPGAGVLEMDSLVDSDQLLAGYVPESAPGGRVYQDYQMVGDLARVVVQMVGSLNFVNSSMSEYSWKLGLTSEIPVDLVVSIGAGQSDLDLSGLQISALETEMGVGELVVRLPESGEFNANISEAIGQVTIIVPDGLEVSIEPETVLALNSISPNLEKQADGSYTSPGYGASENQAKVQVSVVIGSLVVKTEP